MKLDLKYDGKDMTKREKGIALTGIAIGFGIGVIITIVLTIVF